MLGRDREHEGKKKHILYKSIILYPIAKNVTAVFENHKQNLVGGSTLQS